MRARGFALSEVLVAVAIGGLILTSLTWLQVDYVALSRKVADLGAPLTAGARLQRAAADEVRCGRPDTTLAVGQTGLASLKAGKPTGLVALTTDDGGVTTLAAATGGAATFSKPVRLVTQSAPMADGSSRPGWSMAAVEAGGQTIAVIGERCDLPQVCSYDALAGRCRGEE